MSLRHDIGFHANDASNWIVDYFRRFSMHEYDSVTGNGDTGQFLPPARPPLATITWAETGRTTSKSFLAVHWITSRAITIAQPAPTLTRAGIFDVPPRRQLINNQTAPRSASPRERVRIVVLNVRSQRERRRNGGNAADRPNERRGGVVSHRGKSARGGRMRASPAHGEILRRFISIATSRGERDRQRGRDKNVGEKDERATYVGIDTAGHPSCSRLLARYSGAGASLAAGA